MPIYVTSPSLPPLAEFIPYLEEIWKSKWLTNNGQFHQQFEAALAEYLGVKYVSFFTNGMVALQAGLHALRVTGEVITTPFTFVATTHAIHLHGFGRFRFGILCPDPGHAEHTEKDKQEGWNDFLEHVQGPSEIVAEDRIGNTLVDLPIARNAALERIQRV